MWSILFISLLSTFVTFSKCNRYADELCEDLLYNYDKNIRPVKNHTKAIKVEFGASLLRIIDVDEINQVLTTNLLMQLQWFDYRLVWDPSKWNGIRKLHLPADQIWLPDIVLYTNADGEPQVSVMSEALVLYSGTVIWTPPSIYKSFCPINIEYFPYDQQSCVLKFGGWTYHGYLLDVQKLPIYSDRNAGALKNQSGNALQYSEDGMDLSSFYAGGEWDLIDLTNQRNEQLYPGCCGEDFYIDISFVITIRRKTLFYTVNLVIPCALIAILATIVFYIPAFELKMTFSISILVSLTVFYVVLVQLIPPTSLVVPLIGRYLLFTGLLVTLSILTSVHIIRMYRSDAIARPLPRWMRSLFFHTLPKYIFLKPPESDKFTDDFSVTTGLAIHSGYLNPKMTPNTLVFNGNTRLAQLAKLRGMHPDLIRRMIDNVSFISDYFSAIRKAKIVAEDWSYVAMVMDRILLMTFSLANLVGALVIFLSSPTLMDHRLPLTARYSTQPFTAHENRYYNYSSLE